MLRSCQNIVISHHHRNILFPMNFQIFSPLQHNTLFFWIAKGCHTPKPLLIITGSLCPLSVLLLLSPLYLHPSMTFSFLTFLGPNASVLLSSLSGYIRLLRIPPPSPNHFTLRLSSCCNWTGFDRLPFLFISFPFFFLLLTHFYFSLFFSRMRYIQFFAFSLSILCPFFFIWSHWTFSSTPLGVFTLHSKTEEVQEKKKKGGPR